MDDNSTSPVISLLENYGWYILGISIVFLYILRKLDPTLNKYLQKRADDEYASKYHKNPDLLEARITAQQTVVQKLQEKYIQDAEKHQIKMEAKAQKQKEDWLLRNTAGGYKLGSSTDQNSLKQDYNPLVGDTSRSYRPQRRSPCSGGGCGK